MPLKPRSICSLRRLVSRALRPLLLLPLLALPAHAQIFINEADADQVGADAAEFVELFNAGAAPVTLTGYVLVFFNGNTDTSYSSLGLGDLTIPAGGFAVIGNSGVPNVGPITFEGNFLQNGQDGIALYSGVPDATSFPNGTPVTSPPPGAQLVDAVVYGTDDADDPVLLDNLTPGQPQINEGTSGLASIARVPDGGILRNTSTYGAQTPTPGTSNSGASSIPTLTLTVDPVSFAENAGASAATGTITRTGPTTEPLTVTLSSANTSEATVPASVLIAAGADSATFSVSAVDELISDGDKTFNLTAAATGFTATTRSITVTDNEPILPALELAITTLSLTEGGPGSDATITRPATGPLPALTVTLTSSNPDRAPVSSASVIIPAGDVLASFTISVVDDSIFTPSSQVIISAAATGFVAATATLTILDDDSPPAFGNPTVVINKYLNATPDLVELLVIGTGTAGQTVDMRRMLIKDFSGSMGNDGGRSFRFADSEVFAAIKAGTLIVLSNNNTSADIDGSDFILRLGLTDPTYFTAGSGTFDISTTEMVMIKKQDAAPEGVIDSIHALAAGAPGAQFNLAPEFKLIASTTTGTNRGVIALTPNSSINDYNGLDATGDLPLTAADFGLPNDVATSGPNFSYIQTLRGIDNINGTGTGSITNNTPATPWIGKNIFARNQTGQTITLTVQGTSTLRPLTAFKVTVPASFGVPLPSSVSVSGTGAGNPVISISGQVITVTGVSITASGESAILTLNNLITPSPLLPTDESGYLFALETSENSTVFAPVVSPPAAAVLIPISALRDVDANGVPSDNNKLVAIEGICTEDNLSTNGDTTAFLQGGNFGIGLYAGNASLNLTRGKRYAVTGTMSHFNGLSQLLVPSEESVVDLGAAAEPAPLTLTLTEILASPEVYEGRLVRVEGLVSFTGTWAAASTLTVTDNSGVNLQVRIQAGSGAVSVPDFPLTITAVLGQFDGSSPFTEFYQLLPRENDDLETSVVDAYGTWAAGFPGIGGPNADSDGDGQSNYLEYALGTSPNDLTSSQPITIIRLLNTPGFSITKGPAAAADPNVVYTAEGSPDLINWMGLTDSGSELEEVTNNATTFSVRYLGTSDQYYFRLIIQPPPPAP